LGTVDVNGASVVAPTLPNGPQTAGACWSMAAKTLLTATSRERT
jgi:hypothetical protein